MPTVTKLEGCWPACCDVLIRGVVDHEQLEFVAAALMERARKHEHVPPLAAQAAKYAEEKYNNTQLVSGVLEGSSWIQCGLRTTWHLQGPCYHPVCTMLLLRMQHCNWQLQVATGMSALRSALNSSSSSRLSKPHLVHTIAHNCVFHCRMNFACCTAGCKAAG
jgi:hypothetical protein